MHAVQGSAHLFSNLQADIGKHMQKFEQNALRTSLRVPAGLVHPSALPPALDAPHTPEDEAQADAQLAELCQRIAEVCQCARSLTRSIDVRGIFPSPQHHAELAQVCLIYIYGVCQDVKDSVNVMTQHKQNAQSSGLETLRGLLQVRKERMTLDMQTLRMERELARYGETSACASHARATAGQSTGDQHLSLPQPPMWRT